MLDFEKEIKQNFIDHGDEIALEDELGNVLTYRDLDILSAMVCGYIKRNKLIEEEFVCIDLPRNVFVYSAILGVIRAGVACTVLDPSSPTQRKEYIKNELHPALYLNKETWAEVVKEQPNFKWSESAKHDALFAVYTSGTTGNPKAVLLERGVLDMFLSALDLRTHERSTKSPKYAVYSPLDFIAIQNCLAVLQSGSRLQMISEETFKDTKKYIAFLEEHRSTDIYMLPSMYKIRYKQIPDCVKHIYLSAERSFDLPASEKQEVINLYISSETGFCCAQFSCDGRQGNMPLGKPTSKKALLLLGQDNIAVSEAEVGDIYAYLPYTRGYINRPDETKASFKKSYFKTGDFGTIDKDGNIICLGRSDDMVKILGNRIEPNEVCEAFKKVSGITDVFLRAFDAEDDNYLCMYYANEENIKQDEMLIKMSELLPRYMLPHMFIRVNEIPRNAAGKVLRTSLPRPDFSQNKSAYIPASSQEEKRICDAFASVLRIDNIGIFDDFFKLGGNDISAMKVLSMLGIEELSVIDFYRLRTAFNLAEYLKVLREKNALQNSKEKAFVKEIELPLNPSQKFMLSEQLKFPEKYIYNSPHIFYFDSTKYNPSKLCTALNSAIYAHPALYSIFAETDDGMVLKSSSKQYKTVKLEKYRYTDFRIKLRKYIQPFAGNGEPLFRAFICDTEVGAYITFDAFCGIFDRLSAGILIQDVVKIYKGLPIDKDQFYTYTEEVLNTNNEQSYKENKLYLDTACNKFNTYLYPSCDTQKVSRVRNSIDYDLGEFDSDIKEFLNRTSWDLKMFFMICVLFAEYVVSQGKKVGLGFEVNTRNNPKYDNSIGNFSHILPAYLNIDKKAVFRDVFWELQNQITKTLSCSSYDWGSGNGDSPRIVLKYRPWSEDKVYGLDGVEEVSFDEYKCGIENPMNIVLAEKADGFKIVLEYDGSMYVTENAKGFLSVIVAVVQTLLYAPKHEEMTVYEFLDFLKKIL